jgi:hypothetical protein
LEAEGIKDEAAVADALARNPEVVESMVLKGKVVTKLAGSSSKRVAVSQSQEVLFPIQQKRLRPHCCMPELSTGPS